MKTKILKSSILVAILGIVLFACNKPITSTDEPDIQSKNIISSQEITTILSEINSTSRLAPDWWIKVKKWVKAHTGGAQRYQNGQPACSGSGGCGPCAGICFNIGAAPISGNSGILTDLEYNEGFRSFEIGIIENNNTNQVKILLEFHEDSDDFVFEENLRIENDELIDNSITQELEVNSITLLSGDYPVFLNENNGSLQTIVNAIIID